MDTINELYKYIMASTHKLKLIEMKFSLLKRDTDIKRLNELLNEDKFKIMFNLKNVNFNIFNENIFFKEIKEEYIDIKVSNNNYLEDIISQYDELGDEDILNIKTISSCSKYINYNVTLVR